MPPLRLKHHILHFLPALILTLFCAATSPASPPLLFSPIENREGDPNIRSIIRLADGRMAFATVSGIEIYDGSDFTRHAEVTGESLRLPDYNGFHHLYLSHSDHWLWIKNTGSLRCLDLDTELFVTDMTALAKQLGIPDGTDDIFVDTQGKIWACKGDSVIIAGRGTGIRLPDRGDAVLDLDSDSDRLYLFSKKGRLLAYALPSGKFLYSAPAFPEEDEWKFGDTSLVVRGRSGFYQIRNGALGGLFHFDIQSRRWDKILESRLRLNTLAADDSCAYISTNNGLLAVNLNSAEISHIPLIRTKSGNLLASEISTLSIDSEGGLWLGMLNRGILYHHPDIYRYIEIKKRGNTIESGRDLSSVFAENPDGSVSISSPGLGSMRVVLPAGEVITTAGAFAGNPTGEYGSGASFISSGGALFFNEPDKYSVFIRNSDVAYPADLPPIVSSIIVNGERIKTLGSYDGNTILRKSPSRTKEITLGHDQNFLSIEASLPSYAATQTTFEYMLEGIDRGWQRTRGSGMEGRKLMAYYTAIPPGDYTFKVKAAGAGMPETCLNVTVTPPWWKSGWAYFIYALALTGTAAGSMYIYTRKTRRRIAREQREAYLLTRIRNLIEEVDRYKAEAPEQEGIVGRNSCDSDTMGNSSVPTQTTLTETDKAFIAKAVEAVERNLDTPGYSVAQLSRDMCMDRTGLYRKLTTLLEQSPSTFIRDIRLRNAARLLREGKHTITEIAEMSGFSSTSHMSRCFQERYGCRPSEYAARAERGTTDR